MRYVQILALFGTLAMLLALFHGFTAGSFFEDGGALFDNPWGIVSLVDLYVGFTLFSIWIVYREQHILSKFIWIVLMMVFGFLTGAIYILWLSIQHAHDPLTFIHGHRAAHLKK